jgi:hypothetical protein
MSKSRQQLRMLDRQRRKGIPCEISAVSAPAKNQAGQFKKYAAFTLIGLCVLACGLYFKGAKPQATHRATLNADSVSSIIPSTLEELIALPEADLAKVGIARMNLLCTKDLPGRNSLSDDALLARMDQMTRAVQSETARNYRRFVRIPAEYEGSEEYYKIGMLITTLGLDFGVRYNPDKAGLLGGKPLSNEEFFSSADDVYITGLLGDSKMGTCSSMPVLCVAIGRMLGYPLSLVSAKGHLLFRWDDGKTQRNFECTNKVRCHSNEELMKWPYPITDEELKKGLYLKNFTAREELAAFLSIRAHVLATFNRVEEASWAIAKAVELVSEDPNYAIFQRKLANFLTYNRPPPKLTPEQVDAFFEDEYDEVYRKAILRSRNTNRPPITLPPRIIRPERSLIMPSNHSLEPTP